MADFDPYLEWLGIPTQGRAPHHYRLLGLDLFESDTNIIAGAADRQIAHVKTFQNGPQGNIAQDVLNRLANARLTLLKPESKSAYDHKLKQKIHEMRAAQAQAKGVAPQSRPVPATQHPPGSPVVEISGAPITTAPPRKKGNPLLSIIFMIATWLSSAVAAVVVGYFIINSSWFPGNQPDPDVIDGNDDGNGRFAISVDREDPKKPLELPKVEDVPALAQANTKPALKTPVRSDFRGDEYGSSSTGSDTRDNPRTTDIVQSKVDPAPVSDPKFFGSPDKTNPADSELPIEKSTVPDREILVAHERELESLYQTGYDKNAPPMEKKKLAEALLKDGLATREPTMQFAMLQQSVEIASSIADGETAVKSLEEMDRRFEIEFWTRADAAIALAKRKAKAMPQYMAMAEGIDKLIGRAFSDNQFDEAFSYSAIGAQLARKFKDQPRFDRLENLSKSLKDVKLISQQSVEAETKLAADPNDPQANLERGNFLFLVEDDLGTAIKYWKKSSSEELKKIAELEDGINNSSGDQLLELATCWRELGERQKTFADIQFSFRAKELCERSATMLDGLTKLKAETAARELGESLKGRSPFREIAMGSSEFQPTGSAFLDNVYQSEWRIDFSTSTSLPDIKKATFSQSGIATLVTLEDQTYHVNFTATADSVFWVQNTIRGESAQVALKPYSTTSTTSLKCYYIRSTSTTKTPSTAGYAYKLNP